jgi:H+-transporting ATPase
MLTSEEAANLQLSGGYNELPEKKENVLLKFLSYFWGPIPWMIEVAAILSIVVGAIVQLIIILALLLLNAAIGFWQEKQASNAVAALKKQLASRARVKRDGEWKEIPARELVPGDLVRLRLGDIVPADIQIEGDGYLNIDESALTGESLPVSKKSGDTTYSGSIIKQGECEASVTATGSKTYFGKTAKLVGEAKSVSHFQKAVLQIGDYLIYMSVALAVILIVVQMSRGESFLHVLQFTLILVVASIPVAMPAVLSVTMAVGAMALAKLKAIVTRLESIEELAGMDILCSDKTGTLTQNKLALGKPISYGEEDPVLMGVLASKSEDNDPIDLAIIKALGKMPEGYNQVSYKPFDPVGKRTEATIEKDGAQFLVSKGAPQVILTLCNADEALQKKVNNEVDALAAKGYRTLGVAKKEGEWKLLGILPLSDPPREDSKETIAAAKKYGIDVKMVTGDHTAIAKEIASQLGLGTNIQKATDNPDVETADGFAEVFPENKFAIVKAFQAKKHITGMTGDGVNDAPALKQANNGIAVSGATDAARAAADLVLTAPGLSVIIKAIEESRKIFERMNSYAIYRITETIRIMFFVVISMIVFNFYPITSIMIILLAFFNDLPIMTIAYDNTLLDPKPVKWKMKRILSVSTTLGLIGVIETFGMLLIGRLIFKLNDTQIQTLIFLKLSVAGHLTLFVARTTKPFLTKPYPAPSLLISAIGTKLLVTVLCAFGFGLIEPLSWQVVGYTWGYCLIWVFIEDWGKLYVYHHLRLTGANHRSFLSRLKKSATKK